MASARLADSPVSFKMSHRKFHEKEIVPIEEFVVGCDAIDHFGFENVWGFDAEAKYAMSLVECLSETSNLRSLCFKYVCSAQLKTKDWWLKVASLVEHHETLKAIDFGFTRPKPLIAHNLMERHYEQHPEILESLLISISKNRNLIHM